MRSLLLALCLGIGQCCNCTVGTAAWNQLALSARQKRPPRQNACVWPSSPHTVHEDGHGMAS